MKAFQAIEDGVASDNQQKQALAWLINSVCHTYDMSYIPGDTHATAFAEGKRAVGLEIVTMLKVNVTEIRRKEDETKS